MIAHLRGRIILRQPPLLVLDVNGVGYEIEASMPTFYALESANAEVSLYIHTVVREDAFLLFGFAGIAERDLFRHLLKVNGIGPRVGLAILSTLNNSEFTQCVMNNDVAMLTRVPGIGKKTAERMIFDLQHKLADSLVAEAGSDAAAGGLQTQDAISALQALGYKAVEASKAVQAVQKNSQSVDDMIRQALQHLAKR